MADNKTKHRSPITMPGYRKGLPPPNKGKRTPAEVLTQGELNRLMDVMKGTGKVGPRNRAMVALMSRAGMKIGQVVEMQRWHYEPGSHSVTVPARLGREEHEIPVDAVTRKLLMDWIEVRRSLKNLPRLAPLFCGVSDPTPGGPINPAYIREWLREMGDKAEIDKRVNPSGLRKTYEERRAERSSRIVSQLAAHIEEAAFASRYPDAYERWRDAFDLLELGPERHATRIGHDCRDAIQAFAAELAQLHNVEVEPAANTTVKAIKAVIASKPGLSGRLREFLKALTAYWGTVIDLTLRQDHAGTRMKEHLSAEDARRVVFQTFLVMTEIDSAMRGLDVKTRSATT